MAARFPDKSADRKLMILASCGTKQSGSTVVVVVVVVVVVGNVAAQFLVSVENEQCDGDDRGAGQ